MTLIEFISFIDDRLLEYHDDAVIFLNSEGYASLRTWDRNGDIDSFSNSSLESKLAPLENHGWLAGSYGLIPVVCVKHDEFVRVEKKNI